jgi:hypothetical protein
MADDSLPGPPPLTQSTAAILSQAVEVASKDLRECQRAIEGDQHARVRLAEEFARIAARPKPAPDWEPEELEAAARPRPIEGGRSDPEKRRGLLGVMPLAWRDSCARLAEQLEGAGYAFQAGEVRRLVSSVPRPRPLAPEDVIPERDATAAVVKRLLELLRALGKDLQRFEGGAGETPVRGDEEIGAASPPRAQPTIACGPTRQAVLRELQPAVRKAYLAFEYAESKAGKRLEDQEAHGLLKDEGIPTDKGDLGELADYELPAFDTWSRQVRMAREALGEQKYTPRAGRKTGRSIASGRELDRQKDGD